MSPFVATKDREVNGSKLWPLDLNEQKLLKNYCRPPYLNNIDTEYWSSQSHGVIIFTWVSQVNTSVTRKIGVESVSTLRMIPLMKAYNSSCYIASSIILLCFNGSLSSTVLKVMCKDYPWIPRIGVLRVLIITKFNGKVPYYLRQLKKRPCVVSPTEPFGRNVARTR